MRNLYVVAFRYHTKIKYSNFDVVYILKSAYGGVCHQAR